MLFVKGDKTLEATVVPLKHIGIIQLVEPAAIVAVAPIIVLVNVYLSP